MGTRQLEKKRDWTKSKEAEEDKKLPEKRCGTIQCRTYEDTDTSFSFSIVFTPEQRHASSS